MEYLMLKALNFEVAATTANCFCERFLKESGTDEKTGALAMVRNNHLLYCLMSLNTTYRRRVITLAQQLMWPSQSSNFYQPGDIPSLRALNTVL